MALMLVLAGSLLGPDLALYVAMAEIPVYLLPLVANPLYSRVLLTFGANCPSCAS